MTADEFNAWKSSIGISGLEAARRLGISKNTVTRYSRQGAPHNIALACAAIAVGLKPWPEAHHVLRQKSALNRARDNSLRNSARPQIA